MRGEGSAVLEFLRDTWDVAARLTGAVTGALTGSSLSTLLALMIADYAVGLLMGALGKSRKGEDGRLSFKAGLMGFTKKMMMLAMVLLCRLLDQVAGKENALQAAAIGFYTCSEGISLLQNAAILGIPIPSFMKKALQRMQNEA